MGRDYRNSGDKCLFRGQSISTWCIGAVPGLGERIGCLARGWAMAATGAVARRAFVVAAVVEVGELTNSELSGSLGRWKKAWE